ncbi:MAG: MBL fold metallo-hydrolase [Magnetovibrio sp.]|nr:MBL fold metallo-hydrolase [Magnetovibrio sp.]
MSLKVKFWGVRGSIACPSADHIRYGGNTSCLEIKVGDRRLVMDAGTGVRGLGKTFLEDDISQIHLLLTHTHWDHINGFPFFVPAYDPRRSIHIMAGHLRGGDGIQNVLAAQMDNPMFPVPLSAMQAKMRFEDFEAGMSFNIYDDVHVRTCALNHPNGATGYRIEHDGHSICYITDTEHVPGKLDQNILGLIDGADLVIYDSTYTEEEFPDRIGWGHSTWNEGVRLCQEAGAKSLAIFHHEPEHEDDFMDQLEKDAQAVWDKAFVAKEGMELSYGDD